MLFSTVSSKPCGFYDIGQEGAIETGKILVISALHTVAFGLAVTTPAGLARHEQSRS